MKKNYMRPEAEVISFYTSEEITALENDSPLSDGAATFALINRPDSWT